MANRVFRTFFEQLQQRLPALNQLDDSELMRRFVDHRDQGAFEALVWRHERLILGVCQRVLQQEQDVEDAFQATLLILVRKGRSINKTQSVSSWLYKVAYRVALRTRQISDRRDRHEKKTANIARATARSDPALQDNEFRVLLDREISRLPEKYRLPIVLCYMEGRNYSEAAQALGVPKGTISSRLSKGREILQARFRRLGIGPGVGGLGATLLTTLEVQGCSQLVKKSITAVLLPRTFSSRVLTISNGVLRAMFYKRLTITTAAGMSLVMFCSLLVLLAFRGSWMNAAESKRTQTGTVSNSAQSKKKPQQKSQKKSVAKKPGKKRTDLERLQGYWKLVSVEIGGKKHKVPTPDDPSELVMRIEGNKIYNRNGGLVMIVGFRIDPSKKPKTIDWLSTTIHDIDGIKKKVTEVLNLGIYEVKGDTLRICSGEGGGLPGILGGPPKLVRPKEFSTNPKSTRSLVTYERTTAKAWKPKVYPIPDFQRAEMTVYKKGGKNSIWFRRVLTDRKQIRKLASYFPGVGSGRKSDTVSSWPGFGAVIKFHRKKGKATKVTVAGHYKTWTEGNGEFALRKGFQQYLRTLAKPKKKTR